MTAATVVGKRALVPVEVTEWCLFNGTEYPDTCPIALGIVRKGYRDVWVGSLKTWATNITTGEQVEFENTAPMHHFIDRWHWLDVKPVTLMVPIGPVEG